MRCTPGFPIEHVEHPTRRHLRDGLLRDIRFVVEVCEDVNGVRYMEHADTALDRRVVKVGLVEDLHPFCRTWLVNEVADVPLTI